MSDLTDSVGGAHLYDGLSYSYVPDRFNNLNSAISFNYGYLRVPSGVYFNGDSSITTWINFKSFTFILSFGNIGFSDYIFIDVSSENIYCLTYQGSLSTSVYTLNQLQLNTWTHVAFIIKGTIGNIYVNGVLKSTYFSQLQPLNVVRTSNYIGKNDHGKPNAFAIYDDVKIFKGALTSNQILYEYKSSYSGKYSLYLAI